MKYITAEEMARIDKLAMGKYGIKIEQMMENAGRNLARFVSRFKVKKVIVLYGKGNNGGGGLVSARHFAIQGKKTEIVFASREGNENVKHNLRILGKMGVKPRRTFKADKGDIIVDALLGYNIRGNPRGKYAELITLANGFKKNGAKIVSLDIPSGINPNSGEKYKPFMESDYVLTLALPKKGLQKMKNVYLANIGIPNELYKGVGLRVGNYFSKDDVVKV